MKILLVISMTSAALSAPLSFRGQTHAAEGSSKLRNDPGAQIGELSRRVVKLSETLENLQARLARSLFAVPTEEEFRQRIADARRSLEKRRAGENEQWKEVKRLAEARGVKLDIQSLRNVVPEALEQDPEFLRARQRALDESRLMTDFEERLIKVMLTTTFGKPDPFGQILPDEKAIAREWENLGANQRSFSGAVQDVSRKAAAAKLSFDLSDLRGASAAKGDRAFTTALERAAIQRAAREASAELVAALEFRKAVGPLRKNW